MKFYEPYAAKIGKWFPIVQYEDTTILVFGFLGWFQAKEAARLLNLGYLNGVCGACARTEEGSKILKSFYN